MLTFRLLLICLALGAGVGLLVWGGVAGLAWAAGASAIPVTIQGPITITGAPGPPPPPPPPPPPVLPPANPGLGQLCVCVIVKESALATYTAGQQALWTQGEAIGAALDPLNAYYRGCDVGCPEASSAGWQAAIAKAGVPCIVMLDVTHGNAVAWSGVAPNGMVGLLAIVKALRGTS